jgi:hypothetical protein
VLFLLLNQFEKFQHFKKGFFENFSKLLRPNQNHMNHIGLRYSILIHTELVNIVEKGKRGRWEWAWGGGGLCIRTGVEGWRCIIIPYAYY